MLSTICLQICQPSVYRYPEGHQQHCFSTPPSRPPDDVELVDCECENEPTTTCSRALWLDGRSQLKGTAIFLNEDLTKPEQEQKKRLLPKLKALQAKNIKSVHFRRAVLYFQKQPLTDTKMEELLQTPGSSDCMDSSTQKTPIPASDRMETSNSTSAK